MLYFVAMVLPPLAVLFTGRKTAAILNIPLTLAGWLPGVLHAVLVVNEGEPVGEGDEPEEE